MTARFRRLCAVCFLLMTLTACSTVTPTVPPVTPPPVTEEATPLTPSALSLAYSRADSLDPFKMTSRVNRELVPLLYEGLTVLDATMQPQPQLAESVQLHGTEMTVRLAEGALFSDGTPVGVEDVLASFAAARESEAYVALLANVTEAVAAEDGRSVIFTLAEEDVLAAACLTFPVVRYAEDGTVLGSGNYVFESTPRLVASRFGEPVSFAEIRLLDLVNDSECTKGVELGRVSYFYSDLTDGELPRVSVAATAVDTEYLVFLGMNAQRRVFEEAAVRRAVSLAVDRTRLAESAFAGYAAAAETPFPVPFSETQLSAVYAAAADGEAAVTLLANAGYAVPNGVDETAKTAALSLLVCADNTFKTALADLIKVQLETVGFAVTVVALPYDDYFVALRNGRCDLYIGEVRMTANMDFSPWFSRGGAASYGVDVKGEAANAYAAFRKGDISVAAFAAVMAQDVPFAPLCWRRGMAVYARELRFVEPTASHAYAGLEKWKWSTAEG